MEYSKVNSGAAKIVPQVNGVPAITTVQTDDDACKVVELHEENYQAYTKAKTLDEDLQNFILDAPSKSPSYWASTADEESDQVLNQGSKAKKWRWELQEEYLWGRPPFHLVQAIHSLCSIAVDPHFVYDCIVFLSWWGDSAW